MLDARAWRAESAWNAVAAVPGRLGDPSGDARVQVRLRGPVPMATMIARPSQIETLRRVVQDRWGFDLPESGRAHFGARGDLVWSSPNQWLAVGGALDDLAGALRGVAAVSDQGDGRALLSVGGPRARQALAKLLSIDLHPEVFTAGTSAVTALAHIGVQIWQGEDTSLFMLSVPRTVAASVWALVKASAEEYGLQLERADA